MSRKQNDSPRPLIGPTVKRMVEFVQATAKELKTKGWSDHAVTGVIISQVIRAFPDNVDSVLEAIRYSIFQVDDDKLAEHGITIDESVYERKHHKDRATEAND